MPLAGECPHERAAFRDKLGAVIEVRVRVSELRGTLRARLVVLVNSRNGRFLAKQRCNFLRKGSPAPKALPSSTLVDRLEQVNHSGGVLRTELKYPWLQGLFHGL
jgi:hypothetical protein